MNFPLEINECLASSMKAIAECKSGVEKIIKCDCVGDGGVAAINKKEREQMRYDIFCTIAEICRTMDMILSAILPDETRESTLNNNRSTFEGIFLNEDAQRLINELRDDGANFYKVSICDAMSIIISMYQMHASETDKEKLADVIGTLSNYNELLTALSKDK